ncbi:MAG: helix-turn-helix domain containing protein [candidate division Zixibacteria bacterium]|nr:helix-turn-helix domain containing protein [Candidatus Tariuqbacter arcticus]
MKGKQEALRRQGTLNPRPQAVKAPLFKESEFFDPQDLPQVKYEMLRQVGKEVKTVKETAASFGFSRVAFYQIKKRFEEWGMAGLLPQERGPRGAHKLTDEVLDYVEQALTQDHSLRAAALVDRVKDRFGISLHPRSLERAMARRQKKSKL